MTETPEEVRKRVGQFVVIRDKLRAMDDAHSAAKKPFQDLSNEISGVLQAIMDATGATSIATPEGTCYKTTRYNASLADPDAFMKFVKENDLFDLMDRKANATAVREYTEEKGAPPPGVNLTAISTVGVRRA
jgi:hypothetical protein